MAETECHRLAVVERSALTQGLLEPGCADAAEIRADPPSEDADDELPSALFRQRIVDTRGKPEVVGGDTFVSLAAAKLRRKIERNTWSMRRAEIWMQTN